MMNNTAQKIKAKLETTGISLRSQRRGRGKLPGVPDSIVWIWPEALPTPECVPLLFELENWGTFSNADRDAIEFGKRHSTRHKSDNDEYEYTFRWPTIDVSRAPISTVSVTYELLGMSTATVVTAARNVTERQFHKSIRRYYRNNDSAIRTADVQIRRFGDTEVVFWYLEVNLFGSYTREIIVPFVLSFGSEFSTVVRQRFPTISLPMGVCVGGDGADRTKPITQETGVEFPLLPNSY